MRLKYKPKFTPGMTDRAGDAFTKRGDIFEVAINDILRDINHKLDIEDCEDLDDDDTPPPGWPTDDAA